ncbi:TetR/AcrR family transcriptional regulator [Zhongshania borealis]|jgi:AcrR family transcriptional regulator|uniref:TetR/AcrR family transcriptional regulator n=1 Tax=Zhongshania borealis TaxID=889488 RepID=A0ABP7WSR8_9GAMM|tara:strand:+ start:11618 stop:12214 length:597 start_codon:yes stop_codon:yes gene_type:complete
MKETKLPSIKDAGDGRVKRSVRSRQLIIDALLDLINEGVLIPTAQQVADRANIAIRTVFRHFSEMEQLYNELDARIRDHYMDLFRGGDRSGSLDERLQHAIERHANAYITLSPVILATHALLWRSAVLRSNYGDNQLKLRKDLDIWLPELDLVSPDTREAIDAIASFEFWHRLHVSQSISKDASVKIIISLIKDLLLA